MKIKLNDPALTDDLLLFLAAKQCVAEQLGDGALEVSVPEATRQDAAALELDLYLRLWEAGHRGARVIRYCL